MFFTSYFSGALSEGTDFFPVKKLTFCYVFLISKCHIHFAVLQNVNYFTKIRQKKRYKRRENNKNSKSHSKVYIDLNCNTVLLPAGAAAVLLLFFCDESFVCPERVNLPLFFYDFQIHLFKPRTTEGLIHAQLLLLQNVQTVTDAPEGNMML